MKFIYTVFFVFAFATLSLAQRVATASPSSDFKTVKAGFVESVFTFNEALTAQESANIVQWAVANAPHISIAVSADNKQLTLKLTPEYNQRAPYDKTFAQINVEEIIVPINGQQVSMSKESFFEKFNL